jgi:hypothetical protein
MFGLNQLYKGTLRELYSEPDGTLDCPAPDACNPIIKRLAELNLVVINASDESETGWAVTITALGAREIGKGFLPGALPFFKPKSIKTLSAISDKEKDGEK